MRLRWDEIITRLSYRFNFLAIRDLDGRPHDPRQNLKARQSLPARSVRAGGMGRAGQDKELGTLQAQILDRSRQEAVAPQRARNRAGQQTCPHRLGGAGSKGRAFELTRTDDAGVRPA